MQKQYLTDTSRTPISPTGAYCVHRYVIERPPQSFSGIHNSGLVLNRVPGGLFRQLLAMAQQHAESFPRSAISCAGPGCGWLGKAAW
jgi:hypothetical protein